MFLTVQVKGATQEFKKRTTVLVKNEESLAFVQTDKPIYKPEQTGTKRPIIPTASKKKNLGSSHHGAGETNLIRNHEVLVWTPGLAQWVKNPCCRELWCRSQTWLGCGIAVAVS